MARTFTLAAQSVNAAATAAFTTPLNGGSLELYAGVTKLATLAIPTPSTGAPSAGVVTVVDLSATAAAGGTATNFRALDASSGLVATGSVGVKDSPNPGDRYDLEGASALIQAGALVTVKGLTLAIPAS